MARVSGIWFGSNGLRRQRVRPLVWCVRSLRMPGRTGWHERGGGGGNPNPEFFTLPSDRLSFVLLTEK